MPNSSRHPSRCICPSAGGPHSSSIRRTGEFLLSRLRLRKPGPSCDSFSSHSCNQPQPAKSNTLVVDVTNFSPKSDFQGAHENLHLVERWTRLDADTIEYVVTIDDPTTWTRPWTVKQELRKQSDAANRIYYEPRCHEGNFGLPALLRGARVAEQAFAEGRGPDPARLCIVIAGCGGFVRGGFADEGPDADPFADPVR